MTTADALPLWLFFQDPRLERNFMAYSCSSCNVILGAGLLLGNAICISVQPALAGQPYTYRAIVCAGVCMVAALAILCIGCTFRLQRIRKKGLCKWLDSPLSIDITMCNLKGVAQIAIVYGMIWQLQSSDDESQFRSNLLLSAFSNIAAVLVLPERFIAVVIEIIYTCGLHAFALWYMRDSHGDRLHDVVDMVHMMSALTVLCVGKYNLEKLERVAFLKLQCVEPHAEPQRDTLVDGFGEAVRSARCIGMGMQDSSKKTQSSRPDTTTSGQVFENLKVEDGKSASPNQFKRVADIGGAQHWLLDDKTLTVDPSRVLGTGTFAIVVSGMVHNTPVAVKVPKLANLETGHMYLEELSNELRVLRLLRHPNIVMLRGACIDVHESEIALVLEIVHGELLDYVLAEQTPPSELNRYALLVGITRALCYLHAQKPKIVHADIKGTNILVESINGFAVPKLLDFGLSRVLTKHAKPLGGSLEFMAPEVAARRGPPDCTADVFSLGRLAFFVVTGTRPYKGYTRNQLQNMLDMHLLPELAWPKSGWMSSACKTTAQPCVQYRPELRPSMDQFYRHLYTWPDMCSDLDAQSFRDLIGEKPTRPAPNMTWCDAVRAIRKTVADAVEPQPKT